MNVLGYACVVAFGRIALARKDARAIVAVMALFVLAASAAVYVTETQPAPAQVAAHVDTSVNMEGKEVRFGAPSTAVWTAATTGRLRRRRQRHARQLHAARRRGWRCS